ncbi:uncharacterized protein LOC125504666 [Dendroctonus ponderosae]|nr:uncharacterized protein LOC125504666 [Dendroctonus ponderosae]
MDGESELTQRHPASEEVSPSAPLEQQEDWLPSQTRQAARAVALLLFFSFLMFTVPFLVFYGTKHVALEYWHLDTFQSNAISVFTAVLSVNVIIGIYAYIAYKEPDYDSEGNIVLETPAEPKEQLDLKED